MEICRDCAFWNESVNEPQTPRVGWCPLKDLYTFTEEFQTCAEFQKTKETNNDN